MESNIKLKATIECMEDVFNNANLYSIRHYKQIKKGLFDVRVRHREIPEYLKGTYTIEELDKELSKMRLFEVKEKTITIDGVDWSIINEPFGGDIEEIEEMNGHEYYYLSIEVQDGSKLIYDTEERRKKHDGLQQTGYNIAIVDGKIIFGSCIVSEMGLSFTTEYYEMKHDEQLYLIDLFKSFGVDIK